MTDEPKVADAAGTSKSTFRADGRGAWTKRVPLPDSSPYLPLIGRAVTEWARFEAALDKIIWTLAGLDDALGSCITSGVQGAHTRLRIIHALAFYSNASKELLERIDALQASSAGPQTKRNRIAHDAWYFVSESEPQSDYITRSQSVERAKPGYRFGPEETGTEYIGSVIDSVPNLIDSAAQLLEDVRTIAR